MFTVLGSFWNVRDFFFARRRALIWGHNFQFEDGVTVVSSPPNHCPSPAMPVPPAMDLIAFQCLKLPTGCVHHVLHISTPALIKSVPHPSRCLGQPSVYEGLPHCPYGHGSGQGPPWTSIGSNFNGETWAWLATTQGCCTLAVFQNEGNCLYSEPRPPRYFFFEFVDPGGRHYYF